MKVYISGAITGCENVKEKFDTAEQTLKDAGYEVINPFKVCSTLPTNCSHEDYMQVCFSLINICNHVFMLPDWITSPGSIAEYHYAKSLGKIVECL